MKTIVFATHKGGAGKTTLCRSLAVQAVSEGRKVALLDLDVQGSLTRWYKRREGDEALTLVNGIERADQIKKAISLLEGKGFDFLMIDTVGTTDPVKDVAIDEASLVVIPCQPTQDDLDSTSLTVKDVKARGKNFIFVLTRTVRSRFNDMAGRALGQHGRVAPTNFTNRVGHSEAAATGKTAPEIGNSLASEEVGAIWNFVKEAV